MIKFYIVPYTKRFLSINPTFKYAMKDTWIDEFASKVILDIDKTRVISSRIVDSPIFGVVDIQRISGGSKSLILLNHLDELKSTLPEEERCIIFSSTLFGDNCTKWLVELSHKMDIEICLRHPLKFSKDAEFHAVFIEVWKEVFNEKQYKEFLLSTEYEEYYNKCIEREELRQEEMKAKKLSFKE